MGYRAVCYEAHTVARLLLWFMTFGRVWSFQALFLIKSDRWSRRFCILLFRSWIVTSSAVFFKLLSWTTRQVLLVISCKDQSIHKSRMRTKVFRKMLLLSQPRDPDSTVRPVLMTTAFLYAFTSTTSLYSYAPAKRQYCGYSGIDNYVTTEYWFSCLGPQKCGKARCLRFELFLANGAFLTLYRDAIATNIGLAVR